ncbi:transporter [Sporosarcina sp. P18a]|uniref:cation diffusion facilitator family transporter n=1 Tax=Sporosarcina sp. P18a TaxID=2048259 RepID=UPI000C16531A|nr:cation diffusion facilitator family transporter [Sporosarcina sp. P18a]PIC79420.1 transporter [Sporosarcina sp. P18a]
MEEQRYHNLKLGERGAYLSIVAYICLSILKLFIGYLSDSEALKADGLNNTTDIIASIAVLIGLKLSRKPADKNHKYGHWKSETIASLVASFIMMAVGIQVLISTATSFFQGGKESPDIMAGYVGIFSFIVMYFVYRYNKKLALKINSQAVMAAAKDNISDAWVSIGTAIGIFGSQLNMPWLDTLTALVVGFLICKTAWDIFREASHDLSDGFDENQIEIYKKTIQTIKDVQKVKEIKGRYYGNNAVVDIVILVQPNLSLKQAHDISTLVEKTLKEKNDVYDVHVHVEPNTTCNEGE